MVVLNGANLKLSDLFSEGDNEVATLLSSSLPNLDENISVIIENANLKAQREWFGAIAAVEQLLLSQTQLSEPSERTELQGLLLAGPMPILSHPDLVSGLYNGILTPKAWKHFIPLPFQLIGDAKEQFNYQAEKTVELPLFPQDPLAQEQFCLLLTPKFGLLMLVGDDENGLPSFQFSFDPDVVYEGWMTLRSRLALTYVPQLPELDHLVNQFAPSEPDYRVVMEFSRQLLKHLPELPTSESKPRPVFPTPTINSAQSEPKLSQHSVDIELLQALTHEIRTPLTSIRTMTRLLLRRKELAPQVIQRLKAIDQECTEQINRMELIFRATELETASVQDKSVQLVPTSLEQVFDNSIPRWQTQAERHKVELAVDLPKKLPQVVSNPAMLDQVLTGLIEKFVRSLANGGAIRLKVSTAGHQLKVQFHTQSIYQINPLKALGDLLMFQPETGCVSLNLDVTKNLFQALGGKLTVRQRSQQEEVLTIFLPLKTPSPKG